MKSRLISYVRERRANPAERAELVTSRLSVETGGGCCFFGNVDFGSEPYLVQLGDSVGLSDGVRFVTHDGGLFVLNNLGLLPSPDLPQKCDSFGRITVGNNVFIGMDTIILKGVTIGDNVVVGARSLVTRDLPSGAVYAGSPARFLKSIDEYAAGVSKNCVPTAKMPKDEKKVWLLEHFDLNRK